MATLASSLALLKLSTTVLESHRRERSLLSSALPHSLNFYPGKEQFEAFHQRRSRGIPASGSSENRKRSGEEDKEDPSVPSWAQPGSDEPPPWARQETQKESSDFQFPFYVYLIASAITAIAAIGSVFEYVNQRPIFGVVNSDSVIYAPVLLFFAITGIPSSAFLWFKAVQAANKEAEEQDRRDGYL